QAEDGIRDFHVTGVQTCALPIFVGAWSAIDAGRWIVVSAQPATLAEAAARRMTRRSALALTLSLLLTALLSWLAWRRLVRPLRRSEERRVGYVCRLRCVRSISLH